MPFQSKPNTSPSPYTLTEDRLALQSVLELLFAHQSRGDGITQAALESLTAQLTVPGRGMDSLVIASEGDKEEQQIDEDLSFSFSQQVSPFSVELKREFASSFLSQSSNLVDLEVAKGDGEGGDDTALGGDQSSGAVSDGTEKLKAKGNGKGGATKRK